MTQENLSFSSLNLSEPLLKALNDLSFQTPSAIQQQTIPWLTEGRDLIGQAQTGTGKTAAFALPILQRLVLKQVNTQALILAPTRELAIQVAEHFESLSKYLPGVSISVLCGGQDYRPQLKKLRDGAHVVVGTPGRVLDHLERGSLKLNDLRTFVLDEADEMLRMGFIEDVETILAKLPSDKQMALFSATMPSRIRQIANRYLNDPVSVAIKMQTATVKSIEQRFLFANQAQKPNALLRVLAAEDAQGIIVFVRTKSSADTVAEHLQQYGHRAMAIHGDLSQPVRERMITQFKKGSIDILVATDVAARGLDVERVTHVINYDIAQDCETYVHRIGRTGRAGRSGVTILFVTPKESRLLTVIERHTKQRITKISVPSNETIYQAQQQRLLNRIKERMTHESLPAFKKMIQAFQQSSDCSSEDMAAALAMMLHGDRSLHIDLPEVNERAISRDTSRDNDSRARRAPRKDSQRQSFRSSSAAQALFRLEVGRTHGAKPGNIVGAIANEAGISGRDITGLKIHDNYSTVMLPKDIDKQIVNGLTKAWVCGRQLNIKMLGAA